MTFDRFWAQITRGKANCETVTSSADLNAKKKTIQFYKSYFSTTSRAIFISLKLRLSSQSILLIYAIALEENTTNIYLHKTEAFEPINATKVLKKYPHLFF
jgi:hypothetical protein